MSSSSIAVSLLLPFAGSNKIAELFDMAQRDKLHNMVYKLTGVIQDIWKFATSIPGARKFLSDKQQSSIASLRVLQRLLRMVHRSRDRATNLGRQAATRSACTSQKTVCAELNLRV